MNKNGVAIGVTTIVIVVIALLVLVVVMAAFSGQFGGFGQAVRDCPSKGGECKSGCLPEETRYFGVGICKDAGNDPGDDGAAKDKCCIDIAKVD
ncbi:hypothetical protein HN592_05295 [Candidatus Woesearchaeota archaeon]|jgi:hypothetical protein|nr:hypothetical protein [Candidatus Woesearchaeota archaeon]MBT4367801.1 hypothetical protein [Candidatus Woesearchaeota archaeon]MBT4712289.1 hypothetical protein [Candidatus Woesearchaeota archaeon]MBT6638837.1 hypothetical protein [Candidatus Woesearchaeota archaeon]MBT7134481.1 hypothetical protein [Candidatus Woesearchaeota archaeon]